LYHAYALDQAKADVASKQATLDQGKRDLDRAKNLSSAAITVQQVEQRQQAVDVDQAELDAANAALEVASLNLERSTVVAPVNGIVSNFGLLPGCYAGAAVFALIDSDTFRVEGYFEETKLRRIRVRGCGCKTDRRCTRAVRARREHRFGHRGPEPQHQQRPIGFG
jgi:multidrug resistance efflux pump